MGACGSALSSAPVFLEILRGKSLGSAGLRRLEMYRRNLFHTRHSVAHRERLRSAWGALLARLLTSGNPGFLSLCASGRGRDADLVLAQYVQDCLLAAAAFATLYIAAAVFESVVVV